MSLVSLCIPAFNSKKYISRCLMSLLEQTHENLEVIVVDDASKDNTVEIARSFNDLRIKCHVNNFNLGWRSNVKRCYQLATGDFFTVLGVDDFLEERFVESALTIFERYENVGVWACSSITVDENGEKIASHKRNVLGHIKADDYFRHIFSMRDVSAPPETMIRKKCIDLINGANCYSSKYSQYPEIDLYLKIANAGFDAYHSEKQLTYRTSRRDSLTGMYGRKAFVLEDNYNIFYDHANDFKVDEKLREETNEHVSHQVLRNMKFSLEKIDLIEAWKCFNMLCANDWSIKGRPLGGKIKRLFGLFFNSTNQRKRRNIG